MRLSFTEPRPPDMNRGSLHATMAGGTPELAHAVKRIVGFEGEIRYDISKPDGTPRKLLNVSRINKLGWHATTGLEEGLQQTYDWYCSITHTDGKLPVK